MIETLNIAEEMGGIGIFTAFMVSYAIFWAYLIRGSESIDNYVKPQDK